MGTIRSSSGPPGSDRCLIFGARRDAGSRDIRASDFGNHTGPHRFEPRSSNRTVARELKTISAFADVDRLDIALAQAIGNRSVLSCGKREPSGRHVDIVRFLFSRPQPTIPACGTLAGLGSGCLSLSGIAHAA